MDQNSSRRGDRPLSHRNYPIRPSYSELKSDDFEHESDAVSTIGPAIPDLHLPDIPFMDLGSDDFGDEESDPTYAANSRAAKSSDTEKTLAILEFIKTNFPRFSLKDLLTELFTSDNASIKNVTNSYLGTVGAKGTRNQTVSDWIIGQATEICRREVSRLTEDAADGHYYEEAKSLRIPAASVSVNLLQSFSIPKLLLLYENAIPQLQKFLKAGRTMITSMILNLRSRKTNLHCAMNSLMLWDGRVPRRVVQTLNHYGFSTSYPYQTKAVESISKDAIRLARSAANNPENLLLLPYDNFNWMTHAWETSVTHGNISHDQVSALLVTVPILYFSCQTVHDQEKLDDLQTRHHIPQDQSLEEILPTAADQRIFADNAVKHVADILCDEIASLSSHQNDLPNFSDPHALPIRRSEEYFLPTYDQEQASTRGNMLDVFQIPKDIFEKRNFFLLGDRLTTARDRAAQDQRAVDRSEYRVDHLSSFEVLSGLMHFVMNKIQNIGKNAWGGANKDQKLPNRNDINLRKIDFYAWLRFLDVVLPMVILELSSPAQLQQQKLSKNAFIAVFDRLEAEGVKTLSGSTESGNAVLLMHDLMTMREMCHAIKHGHPERMERILKYWTPMFYAGGSFNYANESMELLHNLNHDWPSDISLILRGGMFMNNQGKPVTFKETDIRVEHFNKTVKSHAHGANARPGLLEKITPAIGHIQELTEQIFEDMGVEDENQHHTKVSQHKDVALLLEHLCKDISSIHLVVDLYRTGLHRLAGPDGGHARHLRRHLLRSPDPPY
ncbi:hypothetical protein C8J57DRAFT_1438306 [Mycena rebaudengoi]|nr:hypothetical protein C8J57DRAFT_1438306 [Mycena rebaudengoi]